MSLPVLYSFRRCPYAMRARLAIYHAKSAVELREIVLRDKAPEMLAASPSGTVPVLVFDDGRVIDESRDIMIWALGAHGDLGLLDHIDHDFKPLLDRYKYETRYDNGVTGAAARDSAIATLIDLNNILLDQPYLSGQQIGFLDWAIAPFIRQFAHVDRAWFIASPYRALITWYQNIIDSADFKAIMLKYPQWSSGDPLTIFPNLDRPAITT